MEIAIPTRCMKIEVERLVSVKQRGRQRYRQRHTSLRYSMSCPNLVRRAKIHKPLRHCSSCRTEPVCDEARTLPSPISNSDKPIADMARSVVCACKCPCPFPCGPCGNCCGCNCLPPPCNTPPRCVQYMTGYYYYPYGVWFCGPYHITNLCRPVGPCAKCPCPWPFPWRPQTVFLIHLVLYSAFFTEFYTFSKTVKWTSKM